MLVLEQRWKCQSLGLVIGSMVIKSVWCASVAHSQWMIERKRARERENDKSKISTWFSIRVHLSYFGHIPLVWAEVCAQLCCYMFEKLCIIEVTVWSFSVYCINIFVSLSLYKLWKRWCRSSYSPISNAVPLPGYVIIHNYRIHKKIICKSIFN